MRLLAATRSAGKQREIRRVLEAAGHEVIFPDRAGVPESPEEDRLELSDSFETNARSKAEYTAFRSSSIVGFFLSTGLSKAKVVKQMERLLALWDAIERQAALVQGGAMFELPTKSNKLRQL